MKLDDIIDGIMSLGWGTLLAKFNVESAYRIIPVHPNDRYLLGMQWEGNYFVEMALPFGLRSAPYIFSSVADLAEWVLKKNSMTWAFSFTIWTISTPWVLQILRRANGI